MLRLSWPDPDEAQDLIEKELSDPRYSKAEPTWWDKLVSSVVNFFVDAFDPSGINSASQVLIWLVVVVIVVLGVLAILVWGRPRLSLTSRATPDALFGEDDARTAAQLRADAEESARSSDWDRAVVLRVRALARGLLERGIVILAPGATVQQFALEASRSFPSYQAQVAETARVFDLVRYVRMKAGSAQYHGIAELDDTLVRERPAHLSEIPGGA